MLGAAWGVPAFSLIFMGEEVVPGPKVLACRWEPALPLVRHTGIWATLRPALSLPTPTVGPTASVHSGLYVGDVTPTRCFTGPRKVPKLTAFSHLARAEAPASMRKRVRRLVVPIPSSFKFTVKLPELRRSSPWHTP